MWLWLPYLLLQEHPHPRKQQHQRHHQTQYQWEQRWLYTKRFKIGMVMTWLVIETFTFSLCVRHLLTGMLLVIASRTPGVFVTALRRVPYFPSAASESITDWEAAGATDVARTTRVARNFIVSRMCRVFSICWLMNFRGWWQQMRSMTVWERLVKPRILLRWVKFALRALDGKFQAHGGNRSENAGEP